MAERIPVRVVDIGCLTCRSLQTAIRGNALDIAYYMGVMVGVAVMRPGASVPLCEHCAKRWKLIEPGIANVLAEEGGIDG